GGLVMFWLIAILSVNVGIFNLLPFPALDGGRIIFVILEMVGIKVNKKLEEKFHMIGMFILFGLIIFATANDLFNLSH
ncbi:MAG: site-2 protease family protein, partial [Cetobacterium sp.]